MLDRCYKVPLGRKNIADEGVFRVLDRVAVIDDRKAWLDAEEFGFQFGSATHGEFDRHVTIACDIVQSKLLASNVVFDKIEVRPRADSNNGSQREEDYRSSLHLINCARLSSGPFEAQSTQQL
jgi:hypothetical protein